MYTYIRRHYFPVRTSVDGDALIFTQWIIMSRWAGRRLSASEPGHNTISEWQICDKRRKMMLLKWNIRFTIRYIPGVARAHRIAYAFDIHQDVQTTAVTCRGRREVPKGGEVLQVPSWIHLVLAEKTPAGWREQYITGRVTSGSTWNAALLKTDGRDRRRRARVRSMAKRSILYPLSNCPFSLTS